LTFTTGGGERTGSSAVLAGGGGRGSLAGLEIGAAMALVRTSAKRDVPVSVRKSVIEAASLPDYRLRKTVFSPPR